MSDYDEERVYASDVKKIVNWYNMLQEKGLLVESVAAVEEEEAPIADEVVADEVKAPVKKAKAKKE
jgi:hypothetical protein